MQAYAAASLTSFALFRWAAAKQTSEKQVEIGGAAKRTNLAHMGPTLCYGPTHVMAYAMAQWGPSQGVEVSRVVSGNQMKSTWNQMKSSLIQVAIAPILNWYCPSNIIFQMESTQIKVG